MPSLGDMDRRILNVLRLNARITNSDLAAEVANVLAPLTPGMDRDRRKVIGEIIVHVVYSMLNFSIRDGQAHDEAVVELKRLLSAYLLAAVQE